jgi:hypothetical protein
MKKIFFIVILFFTIKLLLSIYNGSIIELLSGDIGGFFLFIFFQFTGCSPLFSFSCSFSQILLNIVILLTIFLFVFYFTKSGYYFNNYQKINKIKNILLIFFWVLIILYLIILNSPLKNNFCWLNADKENRAICYSSKIIKMSIDSKISDTQYCNKTNNPDLCYEDMAKKLNDPSICYNIQFLGNRECCLLLEKILIGAKEKNIKICDELRVIYESDVNDIWSRCYKMENYVNLCYQKLAIAKNDENLCKEINTNYVGTHNQTSMDCYLEIAKNKNDVTICNNINNPWVDNCINIFNKK